MKYDYLIVDQVCLVLYLHMKLKREEKNVW